MRVLSPPKRSPTSRNCDGARAADPEPLTEGLRRLCRERGLGLLNREEFEAGLEDLTWRLAPGCEIEERPGGVQVLRFLVRHRQTRTLAHRVEVPLW